MGFLSKIVIVYYYLASTKFMPATLLVCSQLDLSILAVGDW